MHLSRVFERDYKKCLSSYHMSISSGNEIFTEVMPKMAELWPIIQGIQLAIPRHGLSNYWTKSSSLAACDQPYSVRMPCYRSVPWVGL